MKKIVLFSIAITMILLSTITVPMAATIRNIYDPSIVYSGSFRTNAIYLHNRRNPVWYPGLKEELDFINCQAAQDSFRRTGRWSGHFGLKSSCGDTSEPTEWAIGNWLNFSGAKGN